MKRCSCEKYARPYTLIHRRRPTLFPTLFDAMNRRRPFRSDVEFLICRLRFAGSPAALRAEFFHRVVHMCGERGGGPPRSGSAWLLRLASSGAPKPHEEVRRRHADDGCGHPADKGRQAHERDLQEHRQPKEPEDEKGALPDHSAQIRSRPKLTHYRERAPQLWPPPRRYFHCRRARPANRFPKEMQARRRRCPRSACARYGPTRTAEGRAASRLRRARFFNERYKARDRRDGERPRRRQLIAGPSRLVLQ